MAKDRKTAAAWLTAVMALALLVRLPHVAGTDFPLNDGGLFYVMTTELTNAGLSLPRFTTYNGGRIPFVYPPLALYTASVTHMITGWPVLTLLRFLPLIANLATVLVIFFLGLRILGSQTCAGIAALIFVVLPRSYEFLIMGGGLTRSVGFLFVSLSLVAGHRVFIERQRPAVIPTAVCLGFAVMSHPEMGLFAAVSLGLLGLGTGLDRWKLVRGLEVLAGGALVASPWWVTVVLRHGLTSFASATGTSFWRWKSVTALLSREATGESGLTLLAALALLGLLLSLARGSLVLPLWLVAAFVVVPRSAPTPATIPLAMLATLALTEVVLPVVGADAALGAAVVPRRRSVIAAKWAAAAGWRRAARIGVVVAVLVYSLYFSNLRRTSEPWDSLRSVSAAERQAMAWVEANTAPGSTFLVATTSGSWWIDPVDAWFPALTSRTSVATPNGAEWLPHSEFGRRVEEYNALRGCLRLDERCLAAWSARFGETFSHVYVSKAPGPATIGDRRSGGLADDPKLVVLYDGPGATVFSMK